MNNFTDKYNFRDAEGRRNKVWAELHLHTWNRSLDKENFVIDTPPPTISGKLHMGHIFSYSQTDFIARYQRMIGKNVFYPIGFDDNGLPTERLVEKIRNIKAPQTARDEFIKICKQVSAEFREEFKQLFISIGISYDWNLEYHTIDDEACIISQMSFIDLFNKGLIYKKLQPMLWDPVDQTAVAQAEIEDHNMASQMNIIQFSTTTGDPLHIATTRPEMLPACVAIFFHPDDNRYSSLHGKYAAVPIFSQKVPILSDDRVKIDKGTGLVMCCTFGDELDIYWWQKHNLPMKIILTKYGKICNTDKIEGLTIKNARLKIIELLKSENLLYKQEEIVHTVKCAERSGSPLEIIPTEQWFIKILENKAQLLQKVQEICWYPQSMRKKIEIWIEGLQWDWCISRQRYFGIPFPVWYSKRLGEEGKVLLPEISQLPLDPRVDLPIGYSRDEVTFDPDVMDTWATSSMTPQLNVQVVTDNFSIVTQKDRKLAIPVDLRPQSHEIIRTWAFYTIVKACYHSDTIPWKNIVISGWCLAKDKTKMSKSKGNVVTPENLITTYGADVVRYWAANSRLGVDTAFSPDLFRIGQKLINKLWNASKFIVNLLPKPYIQEFSVISEILDLWILSRLRQTTELATEKFTEFEYCEALEAIENFFWHDFCDNYLELVKKRAYGEAVPIAKHRSAISTLYFLLDTILHLFAPFIPYITDEIYSAIHGEKQSVHTIGSWPQSKHYPTNEHALRVGESCVAILSLVRKEKSQNNLSLKTPIKILTINLLNLQLPDSAEYDLKAVCNAEKIKWNYGELLGVALEF